MDGGDILKAAAALEPMIRERADEIEAARRIPADVIDAMRAAGVFRMAMPRSWGGPEVDLWTQVQIVEALSRADASVGWCAMIGSDGGFYSAFLDDEVGRSLWPDLDAVTAGFITPTGSAVVDGDDFVVSGRWPFGSAGVHSQWLASGCIVVDGEGFRMAENGLPELIVAMLPTEACEIHDTWYTTGLRGTSSNDYSVEGLRIPASQTFHLMFGSPARVGGIYAAGNLFLANMAGVPLGIARRAIDELRQHVLTKRSPLGVPLSDSGSVVATVARLELQLAAARALVREVLVDVTTTLEGGGALSDEQRARYRGCLVHATEMGREVALAAYATAGGSAVYAKNPFDRLVRDALTAAQHTVFQEPVVEDCGRLFLGLAPVAPLI